MVLNNGFINISNDVIPHEIMHIAGMVSGVFFIQFNFLQYHWCCVMQKHLGFMTFMSPLAKAYEPSHLVCHFYIQKSFE